MDIMWHGQSCFTIKGKKGTVVTNPYVGIKNEKLKADIILVTDIPGTAGTAAAKDAKKLIPVARMNASDSDPKIFDVPGEYEMSEIAVIGLQAQEEVRGERDAVGDKLEKRIQMLKKTVFQFRVDDISICLLGNIEKPLPSEMIEKIGDVDVLLIPVGGNGCLDAKKAHEMIEEIEPRIVIPMCYDDEASAGSLGTFLKNTGVNPEAKDSLVVANKAALPQDKVEYVVLNARV